MTCPYSSPPLEFRAVRPTSDIPIFTAISADTLDYINSNCSSIRLPSESDTISLMRELIEKSLLGAVIWLKHTSHFSATERKELVDAAKKEGKEHLVEEYETAIGRFILVGERREMDIIARRRLVLIVCPSIRV